jgi:predicted alpha/beta superfamily hydrolase
MLPQDRTPPLRRRLLLGTAMALAAPTLPRAAPVTPASLPHVQEWQAHPAGEPQRPYRILAAAPQREPPPGGFPVLYVLDGDALFAPAAELLRHHAGAASPAVVIGIGYPGDTNRRDQDYTLPFAAAPAGTGGADAFLDFIEQELMPAVARRFPVNPARRAIFGHSYGGLLVLHSFFTRPALFHRCVAASPSIWWGGGTVLAEERAFRAQPPEGAATLGLMITTGGLEGAGRPGMTEAERAAWTQARPDGNGREMVDRLAALGDHAPALDFVEFPGETHSSVVNPAIERSLPFALPPA